MVDGLNHYFREKRQHQDGQKPKPAANNKDRDRKELLKKKEDKILSELGTVEENEKKVATKSQIQSTSSAEKPPLMLKFTRELGEILKCHRAITKTEFTEIISSFVQNNKLYDPETETIKISK